MTAPLVSRPSGFKSTMLRGGRDLAVREVVGIVLSLLAAVFIFRKVGPVAYGYVGVGLALSGFLTGIGSLGLNVYLIRKSDLDEDGPGQLLTMLIASATVISVILWFSAPLVELWADKPGLTPLVHVVAIAIFFKIIGLVSTALLERELKFGRAATIDFGSLIVYYAVVLPLVFAGWSYMGIWIGNTVQVIVATAAFFVARPVRPAVRLHRTFVSDALSYGVAYQGSVWLYSLRDLAAPVLLPRLAGMEALGLVTAATQLVQRMGFFRTVVWRLSISGFAKLQNDTQALTRSITEGMLFQVVLLGGALSLFSTVGSWAIPLVFTDKWSGVSTLFPFLAAAALMNGLFTLHSSALFARGKVWAVTKFHVAFVSLLWLSSIALIPVFGVWGYASAEIVAMTSYLYLAFLMHDDIGSVSYGSVVLTLPLVLVPLFAGPWLPPLWALLLWSACAGLAVVLVPRVRVVLRETVGVLRG